MRTFVLHEVILLSHVERRARRVIFDRSRTVVLGANDTGKSSLLKTIYATLGAEPAKSHPAWKTAQVTSVIRFTVPQGTFHALRKGDHYAVFDENGSVVHTASSVTLELAPIVANLVDFQMKVTAREGGAITPPSAYMFLPYYVDQDAGWTSNWSSFARLSQLGGEWRKDVAQYHTGMRPNEYYLLKTQVEGLKQDVSTRSDELRAVEIARARMEPRLAPTFDLNLDDFKQDVAKLVDRAQQLYRVEERFKAQLVSLRNHQALIESEIEITAKAVQEVGADYDYASETLPDHVDCPTCGASYTNSFAERFAIAADEERLKELLVQLRDELRETTAKIARLDDKYVSSRSESERVRELLASRKGEVTLAQIIRAEGRKEVGRFFHDDIEEVMRELRTLETTLGQRSAELKTLDDPARQQMINDAYLATMNHFLAELDVRRISDSTYRYVWSQVSETGSDLPRALLAFYFSVLATIQRHSTGVFCPVIIDAPNQQGQDPDNLRRMLKFIFEHQPEGSQLIIGLEDLRGVEPNGKVVELHDKEHLLSASQYEAELPFVNELLDASLRYAQSRIAEGQLPLR
jgi:hypothetical protein